MKSEVFKQLNNLWPLVFLLGFFVVSILSLTRFDQFLKNQAFADCMKIASYTTETVKTNENKEQITTTSVEPIRQLYKTCIEDKGYVTNQN